MMLNKIMKCFGGQVDVYNIVLKCVLECICNQVLKVLVAFF